MSSTFLIKLRVTYYRAATLLRRWSTIDFFSQEETLFLFLFFLRHVVFGTYSKKNLVSFLYSKVAV